jgi:nitronate monooxygenase
VDGKSTDLAFGVAIPNHPRPTRRLVLAATYSRCEDYGGLGSFGAHGLNPEAIRNVIREIKALIPKPFAMNLWVSMEDEGAITSTEEAFHRSLAPLAKHMDSVGVGKPSYRPYEPICFEDQAQVLLDEGISVFSYIYGIPSKQILDEFRCRGIALIGTATIVDEAIALERAGIDVIAASGFEAGGHRGLDCPARFVPVWMIETGAKGAKYGSKKTSYT